MCYILIKDGKVKIYMKLLQNHETSSNVTYEYTVKNLYRAQQNVAVPACI